MVTISTHGGATVRQAHNRREPSCVEREAHIDPQGFHHVMYDEPLKDAYTRLFAKAVERYDSRQKRRDRQVGSAEEYLRRIERDKKKHTCYELIVGVYPEKGREYEEDMTRVLQDYANGWRGRNPNLHLIGVYYHADERGYPHLHIDYIPVEYQRERGMDTQVSLTGALRQQGYETCGRVTAQMQWTADENRALERVCESYGYEVAHPQRGSGVQHRATHQYALERAMEQVAERDAALRDAVEIIEDLQEREEKRSWGRGSWEMER